MTEPRDLLFSPLSELAMEHPDWGVYDLYDAKGAAFYDTILANVTSDLAPFLISARETGGPVLDLACGSGRSLLPLAQRGLDVVGVDLSAAMLERATKRLSGATGIRGKVELRQEDMISTRFPRKFKLILCAATSVVLVPPSCRVEFFANIAKHLDKDGRFVFDVPNHDLDLLTKHPIRTEVINLPMANGTSFAIGVHRYDVPARQEDVNFLVQEFSSTDDLSTARFVTTRKQVFRLDDLLTDLVRAGLEVLDRQKMRQALPFEAEYIAARVRQET